MTERIRVEIDGDSKDLQKAAAQAVTAIKGLDATVKEADKNAKVYRDSNGRLRNELGHFVKDTDKATAATSRLDDQVRKLNQTFLATRNVLGTLKWPSIAAGAGMLAGELGAVAAGLTAIASAGAPAVGVLGALPGALSAGAQAMGVTKLATTELKDALKLLGDTSEKTAEQQKEIDKQLAAMPASVKRFAGELIALSPLLDRLQSTASDGLLPGAGKGLSLAAQNFDVLNEIVGVTSSTLGDLAEQAGRLVGSTEFGKDFEIIGKRNARTIEELGEAGLDLTEALVDLMVAAGPLQDWLTDVAAEGAKLAKAWADNARESGSAQIKFDQARQTLEQLADIGGDLVATFRNIAGASRDTGKDMLDDFAKVTERWRDWTGSLEGQAELRDYFEDAKPAMEETGRLVADLGKTLARLGNQPGTEDLVHQIRVELLPAIEELVTNLSAGFGPALVSALTEFTQLLATMSGAGGGLTLAVELIDKLLGLINGITETVPGAADAIAGLAAALFLRKAGASLFGGVAGDVKRLRRDVKDLNTEIGRTPPVGGGDVDIDRRGGVVGGGRRRRRGRRGGVTGGAGGRQRAGGARSFGEGLDAGLEAVPYLPLLAFPLIAHNEGRDAKKAAAETEAYTAAIKKLRTAMSDPAEFKAMGDAVKMLSGGFSVTGDEIDNAYTAMRKMGLEVGNQADEAAASKIAKQLDGLNDKVTAFQRLAKQGISLTVDSKVTEKGANEIAAAFERMRNRTSASMAEIKTDVELNMKTIARNTRDGSEEAKQALSTNFFLAADKVQQAMDASGKTTKEGLALIESYMRRALRQYGITGKEATRYLDDRDTKTGKSLTANPGGGKASGGWVGRPGATGRDEIPITVGEGEGVVNVSQQAHIDHALQVAHMMGATPYGSLDHLFQAEQRPHWAGGGFARGGIVSLGRMLQQRGFHVGEHPAFGGVAGVHTPGSLHYKGRAIDVNADGHPKGEAWALDQLNRQLQAQGWHTLWRVAGHFDHLHADDGNGGGLGGLGVEKLKRVKWTGPGGVLGQIGQAGLDQVRDAANSSLEKKVMSAMGAGESGSGGWAPAMGGDELRRIVAQALRWTGNYTPANAAALYRRVMQESGGRVGAVNNWDSNARKGDPSVGLAQVIGSTFAAHRDPRLPNDRTHPLANLVAAIRYMMSRYGRIVDANGKGYARGKRGSGKAPRVTRVRNAGQSLGPAVKNRRRVTRLQVPNQHVKRAELAGMRADQLGTDIGFMARFHDLSDESPTRILKLPLDPAGLQAAMGQQPREASWLQGLNAQALADGGDGIDAEVRDELAIGAHVAELDQQKALRVEIAGLLRQQQDALADASRALARGIEERRAELEGMRDRLRKTIEQIEDVTFRIKVMRNKRAGLVKKRDAKGVKPAERKRLSKEIADLDRDLKGADRELQALTGSKTRQETHIGDKTRHLGKWTQDYDTVAGSLSDLPNAIRGADLDVMEIAKEIAAWTGTNAPPVVINATGGQKPGESELAGLLKQQLEQERASHARELGQMQVFGSLAPLVGGRLVGAFAHGTDYVPRTGLALVHRGEQIHTDPEGPYGHQLRPYGPQGAPSGPLAVDLTLSLDTGGLIRVVDARVAGRGARVVSEQQGQRARLLTAAPGGF